MNNCLTCGMPDGEKLPHACIVNQERNKSQVSEPAENKKDWLGDIFDKIVYQISFFPWKSSSYQNYKEVFADAIRKELLARLPKDIDRKVNHPMLCDCCYCEVMRIRNTCLAEVRKVIKGV